MDITSRLRFTREEAASILGIRPQELTGRTSRTQEDLTLIRGISQLRHHRLDDSRFPDMNEFVENSPYLEVL